MRLLQQFAVVLLALWIAAQMGCKSNDGPFLPPELIVTFPGENIVLPRSQVLFSANMDVRWIAADSAGGTITEDGFYTAPNRSGNFRVTAVAKEDVSRSKTIELFVTSSAEVFKSLRKGGYVVYFRYAIADSGSDKVNIGPEWWKSCDSDTARQLGLSGIEQAEQTGTVFWRLGIPGIQMITSEYCRCRNTATFMNQGSVDMRTDSALTAIAYGELDRHERTLALVSEQTPGPGEVIIMVSHEFGPGFPPLPQLAQGDAVVFKPRPGEGPEYIGIIRSKNWTDLYR